MANISVQDTDNEEVVPEQEDIPQEETVTQETETTFLQPRRGPSKLMVIIVLIVVAALVGGLLLLLNDRNQLKSEVSKLSKSQQTDPNVEAKQLNLEVSKLIEVPTDELPTVATVVDASKVKTQAFFAGAQNGDKVLLYAKAGKAILYRPTTKKIIEVAPINIGNAQTQGTTTTPKKN